MTNGQAALATVERWVLIAVIVFLSVHQGGLGCAPAPHPAPAPTPSPTPPPAPLPPAPKPVAGPLFVSLVFDAPTMTPDLATVRASTTIGDSLKSINATWRNFPADDPELVATHLNAYLTDIGVPCVLVQDQTGKIVRKFKPTTEGDLVSQVKAVRDGK